ncbi:aspartate aminotransferase family protein [Streptomyces sp. NPDC057257]|uniref:aspartate aminotransferase family protein n=1 Tax=Streptomyces sp. NPDC057257 TaxID=3346071 RepID=UPI00362A5CCB
MEASDLTAPGDAWVVDTLRSYEPAALHSQLPVVWHHAAGARVYDSGGRSWLDWTSGILTANAGHSPQAIIDAVRGQAEQGLLHAYMFPTAVRARVVRSLCELTGFPQTVLLTTGAEAVEAALKIARRYAMSRGRDRAMIVSFEGAFHGRTMGAQLAGGLPAHRSWTGRGEGIFLKVPYPVAGASWSPAVIEEALAVSGARPGDVACVIGEVYQGSTMRTLPRQAAQALREWCTRHQVLLILDEMQSGFGRTGTLFGYEQLGARPDLLLCGKGVSGSLPVSAVLIADPRYTEELAPGELTTTHGANPVCLAAAEANLRLFRDGMVLDKADELGKLLADGLADWARTRPSRRRVVASWGMVAGLAVTDEDGAPDPPAARRLVEECARRGLLLCAPARQHGGALLKVMPPLVTSPDELGEGLAVLGAASDAVC